MTRRELAAWLMRSVYAKRMARIGEVTLHATLHASFDSLDADEQANWLDMADAVLEHEQIHLPIQRMQELSADWVRYSMQIADPEWRDEMRRAIIVEMQIEVDKLCEECE